MTGVREVWSCLIEEMGFGGSSCVASVAGARHIISRSNSGRRQMRRRRPRMPWTKSRSFKSKVLKKCCHRSRILAWVALCLRVDWRCLHNKCDSLRPQQKFLTHHHSNGLIRLSPHTNSSRRNRGGHDCCQPLTVDDSPDRLEIH